ncbi:MAG: family 16 glycoside hydrolase [Planctomycetota bacterium]
MSMLVRCAWSVLFVAVAVPASARTWDFEDAKPGELPTGWVAARTSEGPGSEWKVVEDDSAPKGKQVLAQVSPEGPRPLFNLCVFEGLDLQDLSLGVAFKAVEGKIDQGGGPVWRYQDANNYYVARMNPLENNFRVYKVVDGQRTQLGTADVKVPAGEWHRIRIAQQGDRIRCYLDDKLELDVADTTFAKAGKIGLWTKADAVTYFDDVETDAAVPTAK